MRLLFFIIALIFTTTIPAQQTDTDSIRKDVAYTADARVQLHDLKNYTSVFVDSTNKLTIQEIVSQKLADRFQSLTDSMVAEPYQTYWLKLSIQASADIENWWLTLSNEPEFDNNVQHGYVDAWFLNNSIQVTEHQRTGVFVPRSQKAIKENPGFNRVLFSLKSGETKNVFLKIYNEYDPVSISAPQLRNPVLGVPTGKSNMMNDIRSGVMLAFAVLSFFFYFFVKDKGYLLFGIYALSLFLLSRLLHPDLPFLDWFIPEHPHLLMPAFILLAPGGVAVFVLFGRYFINLPQLSKRIDKIFKWTMTLWAITLATIIVSMIITHRLVTYGQYIYFVFIILFVIFLVRVAFFKSILARIYIAGAAWLVFFIILGLQTAFPLSFNPWIVGQLGQLLIYAAGLAYKIRLNEKAKAEAEIVKLRNVELAGMYEESTRQKEEIQIQKKNAEERLVELKATQVQLIQSEKMASLGELTAGIAHEIQNPLNFVNNFSEVNKELIAEMKEEIGKGNFEEVKAIANDVADNEQKINHHGKRADAIVKGMLQHSRSSSATKEPTDINALADEYLRLSYHGLRAKDKSFNADFKTYFNETIGKIEVVPQDIGRVLLNLFTNAFYSVKEKKKLNPGGYEPLVSVTTQKEKDKVVIKVRDNGMGIPQKVLDKIYQPFFTTKPTGQGTGLGLSLSYDIIKAHGGELKVETKEGEFAEFIILLP